MAKEPKLDISKLNELGDILLKGGEFERYLRSAVPDVSNIDPATMDQLMHDYATEKLGGRLPTQEEFGSYKKTKNSGTPEKGKATFEQQQKTLDFLIRHAPKTQAVEMQPETVTPATTTKTPEQATLARRSLKGSFVPESDDQKIGKAQLDLLQQLVWNNYGDSPNRIKLSPLQGK